MGITACYTSRARWPYSTLYGYKVQRPPFAHSGPSAQLPFPLCAKADFDKTIHYQ